MQSGWIVAYSKQSRENYAAENLHRQSIEYYLPRITETVKIGRRDRRQTITRATPLFPRYIFVHVENQWRKILSTYGISGIIMRGQQPDFIPDKTIQAIRERESPDGIVVLPNNQIRQIEYGDPITVTNGPFSGLSGIYDGMSGKDRVSVLLDYLGRKTTVLIGKDQFERDERKVA